MYNPELARYMQPDPIGVNGGMNIYSYVENNPLNYNDPMGLVQLNPDGVTVKFGSWYITNWETNPFKKPLYMEVGHIYTDIGTPVLAFRRYSPNPTGQDWTADCHGMSFAKGQIWINNEQVPLILKDEYIEVESNLMKEGDKIIYYEHYNNGKPSEIAHSLTVVNVVQGLMGYGKGGNEPYSYNSIINEGWKKESSPNREKISDINFKIYRKN